MMIKNNKALEAGPLVWIIIAAVIVTILIVIGIGLSGTALSWGKALSGVS